MRAAILPWSLSFVLLSLSVPAAVAAQDDGFDDEFDDEGGGDTADEGDATDEGDTADEGDEGDEGDGEEQAEPEQPAAPEDADELRARRFRMLNTTNGPTGGLHLVDAWGAAPQTFRVQLATEFFSASNFLVDGDSNGHVGGTLSLSWAMTSFLEAYASLSSYANSNEQEDPHLFQVLGDTTLGAKLWFEATPWFALGGDLTLGLLNTVGDIGLVGKSTSLGIRANATADFRRLRGGGAPIIARFNMQYYLDNSSQLVADVEQRRYDALPDPRPLRDEDRHLLSRIERFALGINRVDRFTFGLGLEAPLKVSENFFIHPLLEWQWAVPVNRQSFNCLFIADPDAPGEPMPGEDGCLDKQGASAFPMRLTLGVRVLPPVEGFSAYLGVDIGLTGVSTFVRELAPTAPYNVLLGASYAYDTVEPPAPEPVVREVERRVEVRIPPPVKGRVRGVIIEQGAGTPVPNAVVRFPGRELTALYAGDDGHFTTYELDPGEVQLAVSAPEYQDGTCAGTIAPAGGEVEVRCELVALPRRGTVNGHVGDTTGAVVIAARVAITGPDARQAVTDAAGNFNVADLAPGAYTARVEAEGYLIKLEQFTVVARETATPQIQLVPRPRRSLVQVNRREIVIRQQINFATDSADILPTSTALMTEIADVLMRHPEIRLVEIQGHTDNTGQAAHNMDLSQRRAESVRTWLVTAGVAAERLQAQGYGVTRPRVPNITAANRARNRRVQFIIKEQGDAEAAPAPAPAPAP